ncbi:MAG: BPTI/Kunitz domain-containing protein, partial [Polyangiaceae bacterium]|nr:BPTI/Kunitz domain-containing protein [Polyangiaceae bacterium]
MMRAFSGRMPNRLQSLVRAAALLTLVACGHERSSAYGGASAGAPPSGGAGADTGGSGGASTGGVYFDGTLDSRGGDTTQGGRATGGATGTKSSGGETSAGGETSSGGRTPTAGAAGLEPSGGQTTDGAAGAEAGSAGRATGGTSASGGAGGTAGAAGAQSVKDFCQLPPDPGSCDGDETAYAYDPEHQTCDTFSYTGCGGNDNRFDSYEGCMYTCAPGGLLACPQPPPPSSFSRPDWCSGLPGCWYVGG